MSEVKVTTEQIGELLVETRIAAGSCVVNLSCHGAKFAALYVDVSSSKFDFYVNCFGFHVANVGIIEQAVVIVRQKVEEWAKANAARPASAPAPLSPDG